MEKGPANLQRPLKPKPAKETQTRLSSLARHRGQREREGLTLEVGGLVLRRRLLVVHHALHDAVDGVQEVGVLAHGQHSVDLGVQQVVAEERANGVMGPTPTTLHHQRRGGRSYSHHGEHLGEDHAGLSQVLVEDALVKVVGGVFDLRGLEGQQWLSQRPKVTFLHGRSSSSPAQSAAAPGSWGPSAPPRPGERWTPTRTPCEGASFRFFASLW